ncbi:methyl-accepting chemotaxis protein [Serpentinimonas barnesii]|uniref:methyl-accepting chemotaxis protein n=1 Tax=Serpentinimonas barnesii TaxID=1458427 RepID=UPI0014943628|nr:methyl-accepting chemotaxis protein [Serpentinimonas barnesii]
MQNSHSGTHSGSLGRKLVFTIVVLFSTLAITSFASWVILNYLGNHSERLAQQHMPQVQRIADAQVLMFRISLEARQAMLVSDTAAKQQSLERIGAFRQQKLELLQQFEAAIDTERGREIFAQIRAADADFWRLAQQVAGKIQAGDSAGAFALLQSDLVPARDRVLQGMAEQRQWQQEKVDSALQSTERITFNTKLALAVVTSLVFLIAAYNAHTFMLTMRSSFARVQRVAHRIANARSTETDPPNRGDEFSSLFATIADMEQRLNAVVSKVRQASGQVLSAAAELDQSSADLRTVTDQQTGAIESSAEHARSMTGAIESSASNADNVSRLAGKASEIASQGGQAVTEVVQEMQRIDEASRRISEIVSVIDGIAFQTNILALNAAVEAARAGEAGRGFAVVAGEVRSLAQRSTQAAREVKQLIETSTQRVQTGSVAAQNAGQTMQRVVESVDELSRLMGSIAQATAQQRASAQELDRAVGSLNESARSSAAVVQRSQETAARLRDQAHDLDETMGAFHAEGGSGLQRA